MAYPLFIPGMHTKAGDRVLVYTTKAPIQAKIYEKRVDGRNTALPSNGTYWKEVPAEAAPQEKGLLVVDARDWGIRTGRESVREMNNVGFENMMKELAEDTGHALLLPPGLLLFAAPLLLTKKSPDILGVWNSTELSFPPSCVGIQSVPFYGGDTVRLRNLILSSSARNDRDGWVDGVRSANGDDYQYSAVDVQGGLLMEDCILSNWSGHGVASRGSLADDNKTPAHPSGTSTSHNKIMRCHIRGIGGFGAFDKGQDANQIIYEALSIRDCGLAAIGSFSHYGAQIDKCMFHRSGTWGLPNYGHVHIDSNASYGAVRDTYGEGDSLRSYAAGRTTVSGGLHQNGWIKGSWACVQQGNTFQDIIVGGLTLNSEGIRFAPNEGSGFSPLLLNNVSPDGKTTNFMLSDAESFGAGGILQFCQANAGLHGLPAQRVGSIGAAVFHTGEVLQTSMNTHGRNSTFENGLSSLLSYKPGDLINFSGREAAYCQGIRCIKAGLGRESQWQAVGYGRGTTAERPSDAETAVGPNGQPDARYANDNYSLFGTKYIQNDIYIGWSYANTDTGQQQYWMGRERRWVNALGEPVA